MTFSVTLSDRFADSVDDGFDLAIRISRPAREVRGIWRKICSVDRVMAASGTAAHPDELAHHSCLAHDNNAMIENWELTSGDLHRRARAGSVVAANNAMLLAGLARGGQGIFVLPRFMPADDLADALPPLTTGFPRVWPNSRTS